MPESRHDYGPVNRIDAEAYGEPGQRTFRLFTANEGEAASLWMEKQQLAALANAIQEQLTRIKALRMTQEIPTPDAALAHTGTPSLEFRVGQMALGFDERQGLFLLLVNSVEDTQEEIDASRPTFSCQATPEQLRELAERIEQVVNAGRPLCPLCGEPMDPAGHHCIRANGHSRQPVPPMLEEGDEDDA